MPPVDATRPSEDPRILNASPTMSNGSPILEHRTETVSTSIELMSDGLIGGMSLDAAGNIYNTNFRESVWRTAPNGETIQLNGEFTSASGNFVLENGDLLQGEWTENRIYRIKPDGTLEGDFWSRDTWHETWTATRDDSAELPDGFTLTKYSDRVRLDELEFPDLEGRPRSLNDPEFRGKVRILELFGS